MASLLKFSIGVILCILLLRGCFDLAFNMKTNKCEMTYMYEYPQYININLPASNNSRHQYKLYIYGEGRYAQDLSKGIFTGIPVLFIPGNQGSYKQVRSLGSVAYRKAIDEKHPFHFNFFSIDFNEEINAFYGPVLDRQTEFVSVAIKQILQLYKRADVKPSSVILIGHSLGGLIAQAVVTLPQIPASYVPLIICQATPHAFPVIVPDYHIEEFYARVNYHWKIEKYQDFVNIVLISVGAGRNDFQVPNFYTSSDLVDVDASTLSVPSCWLTTDHLAIVWCKQLVLATVRALFDSVDSVQKQIIPDRNRVIEAFKYQLVHRGGASHSFPLVYEPILTNLAHSDHWSEMGKRQFQHESIRPSKSTFLMIPLRKSHDSYQHISIIGKDLDWVNWVFACKDNMLFNDTRMCSSGENLSQLGHIIPGHKKKVNIKTKHLVDKGLTHVVVWIKPTDDKVQIAVDVSDFKTRTAVVDAPRFMSSFYPIVVIAETPSKALTFNVTIKDLTEPWQSYILSVRPKNSDCAPKNVARPYVAVTSSWNRRWEYLMSESDDTYDYVVEVDVPVKDVGHKNPLVKAHIILHQDCVYEISLQKNFRGIFQRLALHYGTQLPTFIMCHFVLILAAQLKDLALGKKSSSVLSSVLMLSPIIVVPFTKLSSLAFTSLTQVETDFAVLSRQGRDLGVLPIVLFLASLPLSLLVSFILWVLVVGFGNAAHVFTVKILKRSIRSGDILTEVVVAGFWNAPVVAAVGLIAVAISSCGTLSLCLAASLYFIKIFKLYGDYLQSLTRSPIGDSRERNVDENEWKLSSIHVHFTLMMMSGMLCLLNLPTLISWFKAISIDSELPADPTLIPTVMCLVAYGVLWQLKSINHQKLFYKELGYAVHVGAILIVLFGSVRIYRVSYIVGAILLLVAAHQLFAPTKLVPIEVADGKREEESKREDEPVTPIPESSVKVTPS